MNTCYYGAISNRWLETLRDPQLCQDGCSSRFIGPARCVSGSCAAFDDQGSPEERCTHLNPIAQYFSDGNHRFFVEGQPLNHSTERSPSRAAFRITNRSDAPVQITLHRLYVAPSEGDVVESVAGSVTISTEENPWSPANEHTGQPAMGLGAGGVEVPSSQTVTATLDFEVHVPPRRYPYEIIAEFHGGNETAIARTQIGWVYRHPIRH